MVYKDEKTFKHLNNFIIISSKKIELIKNWFYQNL